MYAPFFHTQSVRRSFPNAGRYRGYACSLACMQVMVIRAKARLRGIYLPATPYLRPTLPSLRPKAKAMPAKAKASLAAKSSTAPQPKRMPRRASNNTKRSDAANQTTVAEPSGAAAKTTVAEPSDAADQTTVAEPMGAAAQTTVAEPSGATAQTTVAEPSDATAPDIENRLRRFLNDPETTALLEAVRRLLLYSVSTPCLLVPVFALL